MATGRYRGDAPSADARLMKAVIPEADNSGAAWPAATTEPVPWDHDPSDLSWNRSHRASREPFAASVPPRIAGLTPNLPDTVRVEASDAYAALTRFDAEVGTLHAPFASILLRAESSASSEVEQLTASAKQVALAHLGEARSANAQLVVANTSAMETAVSLADELDAAAVIAMHRVMLERRDPEIVGQFRNVPVWVGGSTPHTAAHVGPVPGRVPELMEDLLTFARRDDLDVLPQIAIAHAQFETIHPFPDGNGRTGRALAHAMLRSSGTTQQVTVPISAGLLSEPEDYFRALTSYREGDVVPIVRVFTASSFAAIANAKRLVDDLGEVRANWEAVLDARRGSTARRALDVLIEQPVVTVQYLASRLGVSNVAANSALPHLEAAGVVRRRDEGRRNRHWQADGVLDALDAFAARARRATF